MNQDKKTPLQIAVRILIVIGLFIILLLLSFGIIKLVPKALNSLSNLRDKITSFNTPKESIVVTTNKTVYENEEEGILEWKQIQGKNEGSYTFSYTCSPTLEIKKVSGNMTEPINCNEEISISNGSTTPSIGTFNLIFKNESTTDATTTLSIKHKSLDDKTTFGLGSKAILVHGVPTKATTTREVTVVSTSTPPNTSTIKPTYTAPRNTTNTYQGPADLSVNITSTGIIRNGVFIPTNNPNQDDTLAMQFAVSNYGGTASGPYRFKAYLPSTITSQQIYDSAYQSSIGRGQTSYFTIGWNGTKSGANEFSVIVDSGNNVFESNEANNKATTILTFNGGSTGTGKADLTFTGNTRTGTDSRGRDAVIFTVTNKGGKATGSWSFEISFEESDKDIDSGNQSSLEPGQSRTYTMGFDDIGRSDYVIIKLDNEDDVNESSESNNDIRINI